MKQSEIYGRREMNRQKLRNKKKTWVESERPGLRERKKGKERGKNRDRKRDEETE